MRLASLSHKLLNWKQTANKPTKNTTFGGEYPCIYYCTIKNSLKHLERCERVPLLRAASILNSLHVFQRIHYSEWFCFRKRRDSIFCRVLKHLGIQKRHCNTAMKWLKLRKLNPLARKFFGKLVLSVLPLIESESLF